MEQPLFTLTAKDFQSGISPMGAHSNRGGVFYKADGITPLFGAGSSQNPNNGLLMAGPSGSAISYGSVTGKIINMIPDPGIYYSGGGVIAVTDANEIVKCQISDASVPTFGALGLERTVAGQTMTPGIVAYGGALLYRQVAQIGRYISSTYTDNWATSSINADYFGAIYNHYLLNKVYFGNGLGKIGTIDSAFTVTTSALTFDSQSYATAIASDGAWVVVAITRNTSGDSNILAETRILYWDGATTSGFLRSYPITDPFIYSLRNTPIGLFAFGSTGIWLVTFDGVKKVFSISPGVYTAAGASAIHYGQATSFFNDALVWGGTGVGTARVIKSFGKLDSAALSAYLHPVLLTANKNITAVSGQILKGYVLAADSTPALNYYPIGSGTPTTGATAQTVYLSLPAPADISHIDVVFGEPLATGDTLDLDVFTDEDNTAVDFGAVSYDAAKTIRHAQFRNASTGFLSVDEHLSLKLTFTAGAVKIKSIEVFGKLKERTNV